MIGCFWGEKCENRPAPGPEKCKKWRISAGLRGKNGRWGGKNGLFCVGVG